MTAELQGFILSLLSIEEQDKSTYVIYPLEGQTCFDEIQLYHNAAAMLAVDQVKL